MNLGVSIILKAAMYIMMGLGLALVFGVMRITNFAHGECYMMGAYFSYIAYSLLNLGPVLSIIVAPICAFIVGFIIEKMTFSPLRKHNVSDWIMNTFLLSQGIQLILQNGAQLGFGAVYLGVTQLFPGGVSIAGIDVSMDRIVAVGTAVIAISAFWLFLKYTRTGNAISAVANDETGAVIVGVNTKTIYTITFALSCALAALAGGSLISINPAFPTTGASPLIKSWCIMIIVGLGNIPGTMLGGLIIATIEIISVFFLGTVWQDFVTFMLIIVVLIVKPSGIFGKSMKV
jgi:branched-chain amino acid transport system permease protein